MQSRRQAVRVAVCAVLVAAMLGEYVTTLQLAEFPSTAPPIYRVLARQPRGVVAEVPMLLPGDAPDGRSQYMSTFHWFPIVNGSSGNFPPSYLARLERMDEFPGERALRQLRFDRVRYLIVHEISYKPARVQEIRDALEQAGIADLGTFDDGDGQARLYRLR